MRFMIQVRANDDTEAGLFPPNATEMFEAMDAFNQELVRDGWMLAGDGLHPSSKGARIRWTDGKPTVIDGPFAEAKELIAGYWVIEAPSREAVIERFKRCPPPADLRQGEIEIRQIYDPSDFPENTITPEIRAREEQAIVEQKARAPRA
jgi:hypothetical protein